MYETGTELTYTVGRESQLCPVVSPAGEPQTGSCSPCALGFSLLLPKYLEAGNPGLATAS